MYTSKSLHHRVTMDDRLSRLQSYTAKSARLRAFERETDRELRAVLRSSRLGGVDGSWWLDDQDDSTDDFDAASEDVDTEVA